MTQKTFAVIWQTVLVFLFGLVLAVALLEVSARLASFAFSSMQEYQNLRSAKEEGTYRILCLGESTTQGQYPSFLEKILNRESRGIRFSVIDKGRTGTNTSRILERLESYIEENHPQMVVVQMGINDKGIYYYQDIPEKNTWIFKEFHAYRLGRTLFKLFVDHFMRRGGVSASPGWTGFVPKEFSLEEDSFKGAIKADPRNYRAYHNLGRLYVSCGKTSQAESSFLKALELNSRDSDAYFELGQIYQSRGQWARAQRYFEQALKINANCYKAFIALKRLKDENVSDQEEAFLEKAVELAPGFSGYMILGRFFHGQRHWTSAEKAFQKAILNNPRDCSPYLWLGEVYRFEGKLSEAILQYEKAFEVNPQSSFAIGGLISIYEEMGKSQIAAQWAERAMRSGVMNYAAITISNFQELKRHLDKRGIKLVCVQYPMRSVAPLRKIFEGRKDVLFVDNQKVFEDALKTGGYKEYFIDMFAGDFGHCTPKGNELLARNIADIILREVFGIR